MNFFQLPQELFVLIFDCMLDIQIHNFKNRKCVSFPKKHDTCRIYVRCDHDNYSLKSLRLVCRLFNDYLTYDIHNKMYFSFFKQLRVNRKEFDTHLSYINDFVPSCKKLIVANHNIDHKPIMEGITHLHFNTNGTLPCGIKTLPDSVTHITFEEINGTKDDTHIVYHNQNGPDSNLIVTIDIPKNTTYLSYNCSCWLYVPESIKSLIIGNKVKGVIFPDNSVKYLEIDNDICTPTIPKFVEILKLIKVSKNFKFPSAIEKVIIPDGYVIKTNEGMCRLRQRDREKGKTKRNKKNDWFPLDELIY